jgi:hypothetical protein
LIDAAADIDIFLDVVFFLERRAAVGRLLELDRVLVRAGGGVELIVLFLAPVLVAVVVDLERVGEVGGAANFDAGGSTSWESRWEICSL